MTGDSEKTPVLDYAPPQKRGMLGKVGRGIAAAALTTSSLTAAYFWHQGAQEDFAHASSIHHSIEARQHPSPAPKGLPPGVVARNQAWLKDHPEKPLTEQKLAKAHARENYYRGWGMAEEGGAAALPLGGGALSYLILRRRKEEETDKEKSPGR